MEKTQGATVIPFPKKYQESENTVAPVDPAGERHSTVSNWLVKVDAILSRNPKRLTAKQAFYLWWFLDEHRFSTAEGMPIKLGHCIFLLHRDLKSRRDPFRPVLREAIQMRYRDAMELEARYEATCLPKQPVDIT